MTKQKNHNMGGKRRQFTFYFDGKHSAAFSEDPEYNRLFVHSTINYLHSLYDIDGVVFIYQIIKLFAIDVKSISPVVLARYWVKVDNRSHLNIKTTKLKDGRYRFVCTTYDPDYIFV